MSMILKVQSYVDRSTLVSLTEVLRITGQPRSVIERMLEEDIILPAGAAEEPMFDPNDVRRIERCLRLHEDLGVNWAGVAIIERLLQQLSDRERQKKDNPVVDVTF
jgi:hypothetical protein